MLILTVMCMWVLAWNFQAEATYYHRQTVHHEHSANMENLLPENLLPENLLPEVVPEVLPEVSQPVNSRTFYGIMFDAGSTGTRIHIYKFIQKDPVELPVLVNEMYHAVKPGLSAYKDKPEEGGNTIRALLKVAKKTVPEHEWKQTPVVLKATAGLRLLPEEKANALLDEVREVFGESPFFVQNNSVSIMNGTNEGMPFCWYVTNISLILFYATVTVGILDLGGGSTQITFLPKSKKTVFTAPASYIANINMFNNTLQLYTHSYLGNGLVAARLATLGALGADGNLKWSYLLRYASLTAHTACLCYYEVMRVVKGIVHQPFEIKGSSIFYAFSYYFDRAVESGLIGEKTHRAGQLQNHHSVLCNKMTKYRPISPFLCMDMTYITCLLKEGFGFKDNTLAKKVNNVETSWALGATFDHFHNLNIH
uniref:nucleoside diphosphate phosphatase n=1 Tax=Hucho hucho TaxID=62062 RepID=A0A4W5K6G0_9TELE